MEGVVINQTFWRNKRVFLTGHTGFKGSWMSLWLNQLGAKVTGYALKPPTEINLYELAHVDSHVASHIADIRDIKKLRETLHAADPEIIIHMAAQPLVRESYKTPVETFEINVMGTCNLMEAARELKNLKSLLIVTSDKVYHNREWIWGYREDDALGGYDPYSASKGCTEIVTQAFRNSFFNPKDYSAHKVAVASARAGNVVGGGDWAEDRLVPDLVRSVVKKEEVVIRNPEAVRPWQFVLEPVSGYLVLAQNLYEKGPEFAEAWNFGPAAGDEQTVGELLNKFKELWGPGFSWRLDSTKQVHEAGLLGLDCTKTARRMHWRPKWNLERCMVETVRWYKTYIEQPKKLPDFTLQQIELYMKEKV